MAQGLHDAEVPSSTAPEPEGQAYTGPSAHRVPINYGMILFPGFQVLDVFGPLSALEMLSRHRRMNLYMIAATKDPVSSRYRPETRHPMDSNFSQTVLPTHTYADSPPLDVLIVPGGPGTRAPEINSTLEFIARRYSSLQYLITICTGSGLVARTGILDGKKGDLQQGVVE